MHFKWQKLATTERQHISQINELYITCKSKGSLPESDVTDMLARVIRLTRAASGWSWVLRLLKSSRKLFWSTWYSWRLIFTWTDHKLPIWQPQTCGLWAACRPRWQYLCSLNYHQYYTAAECWNPAANSWPQFSTAFTEMSICKGSS